MTLPCCQNLIKNNCIFCKSYAVILRSINEKNDEQFLIMFDSTLIHYVKMKKARLRQEAVFLQNSSSRTPFGTSFYYGWVIVTMSAIGLFFSGPGQTFSISVFIDAYIREFSWSRSLISSIYSAATLCAGLLLFIMGRFVDQFGQRTMTVAVGLLLGLACFWNSIVASPVMLFFGFLMIRLFGQGSMTLLPNTLVPQWFIHKRGRALSFMAIGGFVSSAAIPPINNWLIETFGWSQAWIVWGSLLCFLFVPLSFYLIRNKPEDVGLLPDGVMTACSNDNDKESHHQHIVAEQNWTLQEAMKVRQFWLILFCVAIPSMVNTGITFHLISIMGESDLKASTAAFILSLMALVGFPCTMLSGFTAERIQVNKILAYTFAGELIYLLVLFNMNSIYWAVLFGVIWGIVGGFERIALSIVWPNYFGRVHLGSIKGVAMTATVIGSAFGPLPFGIAFDLFGGYEEILLFMMLFPFMGFLAAWASPPPKHHSIGRAN
jgi:sugar phosphate permease